MTCCILVCPGVEDLQLLRVYKVDEAFADAVFKLVLFALVVGYLRRELNSGD